jgi:hypothetical protein
LEYNRYNRRSRNSNSIIDYNAIHYTPSETINYYRLKQVDFDGAFEYSPIRTVDFDRAQDVGFEVFPNPSSGEFFISGMKNESSEVFVQNSLGQLVYIGLPEDGKVDLSHLHKGVFFIFINNQFAKLILK